MANRIPNPARSSSGFTLVELLVAVAASGIIMYGITNWTYNQAKNSTNMKRKSVAQSQSKMFSTQMVPIFESANIAAQFEHLPVHVDATCAPSFPPNHATTYPCVQQLVGGQFQTLAAADVTKITGGANGAIEFFRDANPLMQALNVWDVPNPNPALSTTGVVWGSQPLTLNTSILSGQYYATWPLIDDKSPPFTIMRSTASPIYYTYNPGTANYTPSDPAAAVSIVGSLVLIYNSWYPNHFMIQKVTAISGIAPYTITTAPVTAADTLYTATHTTNPPGVAPGTAQAYVAVESAAGLNFLPALPDNPGAIPPNSMEWYSANIKQGGSRYLFPTDHFTLYKTVPAITLATLPSIANTTPGASFYPSLVGPPIVPPSPAPQIVLIPIDLSSYYLQYDSNNFYCQNNLAKAYNHQPAPALGSTPEQLCPWQLKMLTYPGTAAGNAITVVDRVIGPVYFARQLGGQTYNAFMFQNPGWQM